MDRRQTELVYFSVKGYTQAANAKPARLPSVTGAGNCISTQPPVPEFRAPAVVRVAVPPRTAVHPPTASTTSGFPGPDPEPVPLKKRCVRPKHAVPGSCNVAAIGGGDGGCGGGDGGSGGDGGWHPTPV